MNGHVAGHEGKPVGQLEATLTERAAVTKTGVAQRGLMDQLKGQTWLDPPLRLAAPTTQQIPRPQPYVLRDQKPKADQIPGDLVGQKLSHATLQAGRVTGLGPRASPGPLGLDLRLILRTALVEFFFEGRTLRSRAARCEC